jgi:hypothetical protein
MKSGFRLPFWSSVVLIPVLILSACAPAAPVDDEEILFPASPTPSSTPSSTPIPLSPASADTLQPTQPAPLQGRLAVITALAKHLGNGGAQTAVQQAQSADLQVQEGVEMITLEGQVPQSYAILYFPDFVNVELFANTKMFLADSRQNVNGSAEVTLELETGHMFVHLNAERDIQVTVQTPQATVTSLTSGAQFDVCRTGELTCVSN